MKFFWGKSLVDAYYVLKNFNTDNIVRMLAYFCLF